MSRSRARLMTGGVAMALMCCVAIGGELPAGGMVVLDTGHTLNRPGSTSASGRPEYAYNVALSDRVAKGLEAAGLAVTRVAADGREVELKARTAATGSAALFVSIHHDSIQQVYLDQGRAGDFAGFSVFVSGKNPRARDSLACGRIVGEALVSAGEKPSLYHATPIKGENRPLLDATRGVHRFDDLVVLKSATSPALLIEVGVIVNPVEAVRLARPQTVETLGRQIADAIVACVNTAKEGGKS